MAGRGALQRRLGLGDAVVVGAGSMIGAGVFAAWSPAAQAAGTGLLLGLILAGVVAFCNATSSAQLAAVHPESGGTYVYARYRLGPAWGHLAGWGFVVGKTASCAAMALTVGAYLWPSQERAVAVAAVVVIALVNLGGLERTVAVTRVLLVVVLVALATVVAAGWSSDSATLDRLTPIDAGAIDILRAGGFMFFAFAGYARIATLGEEVRDPGVTIPKAVPRALGLVLVVYLVVGVTAVASTPVEALAATDAPLRAVVDGAGLDALAPVVRVGAGIAALGVLLNLVPGVSRTSLAMARRRELPGWFDHVDDRRNLPVRAETAVVVVVGLLVALIGLRSALAVSGTAVLTYYAVTNAAAFTLPAAERRWPRWISVVGFVGCVALALALPWRELVIGAGVLALGAVVRIVTTHRRARRADGPS
jgi:APA family basic amino acid/polyamine antiporter